MAGETVATGAYWAPQTWEMARAAYVYDLDSDPGCPDAFLGWLHRAIEDHAARGPRGRAELAIPAPEGREGGRGFNRHHPLAVETREAMEEAIVADRLARRVLKPIRLHPRGRHRLDRRDAAKSRPSPAAGRREAA